jgi:prolyl 4-hydroxylase
MSILDQANRLASQGRQADAIALIEHAAASDDPEALFALANWRLFALFGPRDLGEAHRLFDRAAALGHVDAIRTRAILIGNGTGCPPDMRRAAELLEHIRARDAYAAQQLDFAARMRPEDRLDDDRIDVLSETPAVQMHRKLLTTEECAYLMGMSEKQLQPSFVTHPTTGERMPHPIRTSMGMSFGPTHEDLVIRRINLRIARASGTQVDCGEPLHILRYAPGQEYRPHMDSIPGEANPRVVTMLIYLNDGYQGGATHFPHGGLELRGEVGDALIFRNVDAAGQPDPASLHAGQPVVSGTKWIATRWIRSQPYHPWRT